MQPSGEGKVDGKTYNKQMYLQDTVETFIFQKEALEFKLQHNIEELSSKNVYLTTVLKELTSKQKTSTKDEADLYQQVIRACLLLEDDLVSLDALEKKSAFLKHQALQLEKEYFSDSNELSKV